MKLKDTRTCLFLSVAAFISPDCSATTLAGDTESDDSFNQEVLWDPRIESFGDPGWHDSSEPFCRDDTGGFYPIGIWSDSRGIFLSIPIVDPPGDYMIVYNRGEGWSVLVESTYDPGGSYSAAQLIRGIPGGDIFGWTKGGGELITIGGDSSSIRREDVSVYDVTIVNENLVYALLSSDPRLVFFDGTSWGPYPGEALPYVAELIWANERSIYCAGTDGIVLSLEDSSWIVHDTRTLSFFTAIWGFSEDDVWLGTDSGELLHWDGTEWANVDWPDLGDDSDNCHQAGCRIEGMWGTDGTLFFHTHNQFVMYDGVSFLNLGYWPGEAVSSHCDGWILIRAIWGNSINEVFLAVEENQYSSNPCEEYVLWWDGHEFHWF